MVDKVCRWGSGSRRLIELISLKDKDGKEVKAMMMFVEWSKNVNGFREGLFADLITGATPSDI